MPSPALHLDLKAVVPPLHNNRMAITTIAWKWTWRTIYTLVLKDFYSLTRMGTNRYNMKMGDIILSGAVIEVCPVILRGPGSMTGRYLCAEAVHIILVAGVIAPVAFCFEENRRLNGVWNDSSPSLPGRFCIFHMHHKCFWSKKHKCFWSKKHLFGYSQPPSSCLFVSHLVLNIVILKALLITKCCPSARTKYTENSWTEPNFRQKVPHMFTRRSKHSRIWAKAISWSRKSSANVLKTCPRLQIASS